MKGSHVVRLVFIAEGVSKDKIPELVVHYSLIGNDMVYIAPPYLEMVGVLSDTKGITPNLTMTYLSRNGQEYPDEVYTLMSEKHLKLQANIGRRASSTRTRIRNDWEEQEEKRVMDFGLQIELTVLAVPALVGTVNIVVAITAYGQEESLQQQK